MYRNTWIRFKKPATVVALAASSAFLSWNVFAQSGLPQERPNILWITCEDISPYLGCYGFSQAHTPNLDRLAERGIRFTHAYANAPVCAVARSTILSGMYASSIGTHQMRSRMQLPPEIPVYPAILRQAGYYCTNNVKKDYNSQYENDHSLWDESSNKAHYRNRKPGQPFFAVFNNTVTHESQLAATRINYYRENRMIPDKPRVSPADIQLPPYHPDLPEIREDWARLHDLITLMDSMSGNLLKELSDLGLDDNTIVFFYSDHGGQLSRAKRYIYNVGTQVPMIVYLPPKWQHLSETGQGGTCDRMVSFVDLAKTILSITGSKVPGRMQGKIFLGPESERASDYVHFYRDRMAERPDLCRAVTDGRYYFIRNFMPHRPRGRDSRYGYDVQANWRAWEQHYEKGLCNPIQSQFYQPKPVLELFDTQKDPWHVTNLVNDPALKNKLADLSEETDRWMIETRDVGLIPEPFFYELTGKNKKYKTLYEYAQSSDYPIQEILEAAKNGSAGDRYKVAVYQEYTRNPHPVVRFWGAYGLFLAKQAEPGIQFALMEMMENDPFAANRIMAAQAVALCGKPDEAFQALKKETLASANSTILLQALNALQYSFLDTRLTLEDWKRFAEIPFPENDAEAGFSYPKRIIDDAISLWPERRKVY